MCGMCLPYHEIHTPEHCDGCRIQAEAGLWVPVKPKKCVTPYEWRPKGPKQPVSDNK